MKNVLDALRGNATAVGIDAAIREHLDDQIEDGGVGIRVERCRTLWCVGPRFHVFFFFAWREALITTTAYDRSFS